MNEGKQFFCLIFCLFQLTVSPDNIAVAMVSRWGNRLLFLPIVGLATAVVLSAWGRQLYRPYSQSTYPQAISENSLSINLRNNPAPKIILAWNTFFKSKHFGLGEFGQAPFMKCAVSNCEFTNNKAYFPNASAVVFHSIYMKRTPPRSHPGQLYVFFLRETPVNSNPRANQYNLTMTYRRDSDIPVPVSEVFQKPVTEATYQMKYPFANRTRNVAWVVSHCQTASKRELYAHALKRHIDVDIYGRCGERMFCPRKLTRCFTENLPSTYKFYLAFENSLCRDYVTEKLFRTLNTEIVPIVYGATNYSRDTPPHSVINVEDYSSPQDLARYLRRLASNETEYNSYFEWKKSYDVLKSTLPRGFCRLCEIVNTPLFHKVYPSVQSWWSSGKCHKPNIRMQ